LSMIAVQGPKARERVMSILTPETAAKAAKLGKFVAVEGDGLFIARTGYTGEDGFEIIVPEAQAVELWNRLKEAGVAPGGDGEILSGSYSPTLAKSIAFARVPAGTSGTLQVDIRGKLVPVRVVKY